MRKFPHALIAFALLFVCCTAEAGPIRRAGKGVARAGKIAAKVVTAPVRWLRDCGCE